MDSIFLPFMLQILINFLQVTGIAVFINVEWTAGVLKALGVAGKNLDFLSRDSSTSGDSHRRHYLSCMPQESPCNSVYKQNHNSVCSCSKEQMINAESSAILWLVSPDYLFRYCRFLYRCLVLRMYGLVCQSTSTSLNVALMCPCMHLEMSTTEKTIPTLLKSMLFM